MKKLENFRYILYNHISNLISRIWYALGRSNTRIIVDPHLILSLDDPQPDNEIVRVMSIDQDDTHIFLKLKIIGIDDIVLRIRKRP